MPPPDPFRWLDSSPEVLRLVVLIDVEFPLSLRNVEDLRRERGIDICHETVRLWWRRFSPTSTSGSSFQVRDGINGNSTRDG